MKSLEPSIGKDTWRVVSISLTRDSKESMDKVLSTCDNKNHDSIWAIGSSQVVGHRCEASTFWHFRT
jgi:hypothetical protein